MQRGRRGPRVRAGGDRAQPAAGGALAARAPARRQRVGRLDRRGRRSRRAAPTPTPRSSRSATACCRTASRSTSPTRASATEAEVARGVPPPVLHRGAVGARRRSSSRTTSTRSLAELLTDRRGSRVEIRRAERGDKRRILDLADAQRARSRWRPSGSRSSARASSAPRRSTACRRALGLDALPLRIECFDISNLMGTHTTASMVVFEGGAPKKSDYRRFNVRGAERGRARRLRVDGGGARRGASRSGSASRTSRRTTPSATSRSRRCRTSIVIDGGPGQLSAGVRALQGVPRARRRRRVAGQAHRGGLPARAGARRSCCRTTRPRCSSSSACATRRTASRSPTTAAGATRR